MGILAAIKREEDGGANSRGGAVEAHGNRARGGAVEADDGHAEERGRHRGSVGVLPDNGRVFLAIVGFLARYRGARGTYTRFFRRTMVFMVYHVR
jgi:hypothetical protein